MSTSIDIMKQYGEFFNPADIQETIDDIVGYDEQKAFLHDFYSAILAVTKMSDGELPFAFTVSGFLVGPPGTGKTTLCKAFAKYYDIPIYLIYADSLIGSILGKTLNNIRDVLNAAHSYAKNKTPLIDFFDELDAIASERSSIYEVGEIKRAVVTLLQRMDSILSSNDPIAFLGATNHQHLLDSAVWRRFCYHLIFPFPDVSIREQIINSFIEQLKKTEYIQVQVSDFQVKSLSSDEITKGFTGADLKRGFQIAVLRAIKDRILDDEKQASSIQSAGGTQTHIDNEQRMSGRSESSSSDSNSTMFTQNQNSSYSPPAKSNIAKKDVLKSKKVF